MRESISKIFLVIESIFFLLPLTIITSWYCVFLAQLYFAAEPGVDLSGAYPAAGFTYLGLLIQAISWYVIVRFLIQGKKSLAKTHLLIVILLYLGATLAILAALSFAISLSSFYKNVPDGIFRELIAYFQINLLALPALIPFVHIFIERRLALRQIHLTTQSRGPA